MIPNWLFIIMLLGGSGVISAVITLIVSFSIEKKKNRPDVITHCCRICNLDVYTCYDEKNKIALSSILTPILPPAILLQKPKLKTEQQVLFVFHHKLI